jgi:hypothetical protein
MTKRLEFEPIPRDLLPKSLREFPDFVAMESYAYRAVGRGPARIFYEEYEDALRGGRGNKRVAFRVSDIVLFFASAAASGVIGNLAYAAVMTAVRKVRRPKKEFENGAVSFDAVVSRKTYNSARREKHPGKASRKRAPKQVEQELETEYRLTVKLTRNPRS